MSTEKNLNSFAALVDTIAKLRGPGGCPWDQKQTHLSLKPSLVEECYEVIEAVDQGDNQKLCEELGDLLMQIVLHAQLAGESGVFDIGDVLQGINTKLIRRHPHVFGEAKRKDAQEVAANWEVLKQEERKGASILSGLPKGMPALAYSQVIQHRVARVGFDWQEVAGIIDKLAEEVNELQQAPDHQARVQEFGDILFTLANIARREDVDLEEALRLANGRFYHRFRYLEEVCRRRALTINSLSFEELNTLWEEAKQEERT